MTEKHLSSSFSALLTMCSGVIGQTLVRALYHAVMLLAGMLSALADGDWAVALLWNSNVFKDYYVISTPSDVHCK